MKRNKFFCFGGTSGINNFEIFPSSINDYHLMIFLHFYYINIYIYYINLFYLLLLLLFVAYGNITPVFMVFGTFLVYSFSALNFYVVLRYWEIGKHICFMSYGKAISYNILNLMVIWDIFPDIQTRTHIHRSLHSRWKETSNRKICLNNS